MSNPYIGEIRMFGGNYAPLDWAFCDGALMAISQNETLFNLIGTTYGGDGQSTFALPDLRGRAPLHMGTGPGLSEAYVIGQPGGVEEVALSTGQIPSHNHALVASTGSGTTADPNGNILAASPSSSLYLDGASAGDQLAPASLTPRGGSQPHSNLMPYLTINYIMALQGLFPSPN